MLIYKVSIISLSQCDTQYLTVCFPSVTENRNYAAGDQSFKC
jgi:hypothetical protein